MSIYAARRRIPPKHVEPRLVALRDPKVHELGSEALEQLAAQIKDNNYRVFAEGGQIHLLGAGMHIADRDPFLVFERLMNPALAARRMHISRRPTSMRLTRSIWATRWRRR